MPWENPPNRDLVLYNVAESLRIIGILLQPFMPSKSNQLLDLLRVENTVAKRGFSATAYGSDPEYGEGVKKSLLFPPLIVEQ